MAKKTNQFGPTTGTATATETKAPGDETPKVTNSMVSTNKDGSPRKHREPRVIDDRMVELLKTQVAELATFTAGQVASRATLRAKISLETTTKKMVEQAQKNLLEMSPAQLAWYNKAIAEKLAASGAPELEPQP